MANTTGTRANASGPPLPDNLEPIVVLPDETTAISDTIQLGLLNHHKHFLVGEISYENVNRAVQWILYENVLHDTTKYLTLYINSSGGDLYNAFALIDIMLTSNIPVHTVGLGNIMSAAALIFACGAKGHRYIAKHTGIMLHQFSSSLEGKEHELLSSMKELNFCQQRVSELLIRQCGMSKKILKEKLLSPSDMWITSDDAIKYRLADAIFVGI